MDGFYEALLEFEVPDRLAKVYKKAIETENKERFVRHDNEVGYKLVWSGNHVHVNVENFGSTTFLQISMISHTLPNLKDTVRSYERMGAKLIHSNWKGE